LIRTINSYFIQTESSNHGLISSTYAHTIGTTSSINSVICQSKTKHKRTQVLEWNKTFLFLTLLYPELTSWETISCHINSLTLGRFDLIYLATRVTCLKMNKRESRAECVRLIKVFSFFFLASLLLNIYNNTKRSNLFICGYLTFWKVKKNVITFWVVLSYTVINWKNYHNK